MFGVQQRGILLAVATLLAALPGLARGQQIFIAGQGAQIRFQPLPTVADDAVIASPSESFRITGASQQAPDALADWSRFIEQRQWEKAFGVIETLEALKPSPMVRTPAGFLIPCATQVRRMLLALPAEGKQAFRLFYDAKARALLDAKPPTPADELIALKTIYQRYLISSVGAAAGDRLGDALFERGEFFTAARCWTDVIDHCPEAAASMLRLSVKRATALARAGEWAKFDDALAAARTRYATDKVALGGRQVSAVEFLASLAQDRAAPAAAAPAGPHGAPATDAPLWRYEIITEQVLQQITLARRNQGVITDAADDRIAAVCDGNRLFLQWNSLTLALDAQTGKLLWQNIKPQEIANTFNRVGVLTSIAPSAIILHDGDPITLSMDPNRPPLGRLARYAADTGGVVWSTSADSSFGGYNFVGAPLATGDTVYAAAMNAPRSELILLALDARTGARRWEVMLGMPTPSPNSGNIVDIDPRLLYAVGTIYVLTNDGALLAVDTAEQRLRWAYSYGAGRVPFVFGFRGRAGMPAVSRGGDMVVTGGLLCFKDKNEALLRVVNAEDPAPIGTIDASLGDAIVGADESNIYVLGESLTAYDRRTLQRRWWSDHFGRGRQGPLISTDRVYLYGTRGLFEFDKTTGKVVGMLTEFKHGSSGGPVLYGGGSLILVSGCEVCAHKLPTP